MLATNRSLRNHGGLPWHFRFRLPPTCASPSLLYVFGNLSYHAHAISVFLSVQQWSLESGLEALHRLSTLHCADMMQGFEASGVMTKDVELPSGRLLYVKCEKSQKDTRKCILYEKAIECDNVRPGTVYSSTSESESTCSATDLFSQTSMAVGTCM